MAIYLLTWNPTKFLWDTIADDLLEFELGFEPTFGWSCGVRKKLPIGSRVFMMRLGYRQRLHGIFASGYTTSEPFSDVHWNEDAIESNAQYLNFRPDAFLNMDVYPLLNPEKDVSNQFNWKPQVSGIEIPISIAETLEEKWAIHLKLLKLSSNSVSKGKDVPLLYTEGKQSTITINRYERDPKARLACINHYGAKCCVCDFDFESFYGEIGAGFIHVHHLNPIASQTGTYQLDAIKDLRPVCPNCHAMLHRETPPISIENLRKMIGY
jgi:5-methylcytosine-specific restriction protein A